MVIVGGPRLGIVCRRRLGWLSVGCYRTTTELVSPLPDRPHRGPKALKQTRESAPSPACFRRRPSNETRQSASNPAQAQTRAVRRPSQAVLDIGPRCRDERVCSHGSQRTNSSSEIRDHRPRENSIRHAGARQALGRQRRERGWWFTTGKVTVLC